MAPIETVEKIIAEWTQQPCPPMLENDRPIVTVKAGTQLLLLSMYQLIKMPVGCCLCHDNEEELPPAHYMLAIEAADITSLVVHETLLQACLLQK